MVRLPLIDIDGCIWIVCIVVVSYQCTIRKPTEIKILSIVTNVDMYESGHLETGLWLSSLNHLYHSALEHGHEVTTASPKGGNVPMTLKA